MTSEKVGWEMRRREVPRVRRRVLVDQSPAARQQKAAELLRRMQPNGWDEV